jgi:hypothetical protein
MIVDVEIAARIRSFFSGGGSAFILGRQSSSHNEIVCAMQDSISICDLESKSFVSIENLVRICPYGHLD